MMKAKLKPTKQAHTANTKIGMGDYYGTAIKNPIAKERVVMGESVMPKKRQTKPPKSFA